MWTRFCPTRWLWLSVALCCWSSVGSAADWTITRTTDSRPGPFARLMARRPVLMMPAAPAAPAAPPRVAEVVREGGVPAIPAVLPLTLPLTPQVVPVPAATPKKKVTVTIEK